MKLIGTFFKYFLFDLQVVRNTIKLPKWSFIRHTEIKDLLNFTGDNCPLCDGVFEIPLKLHILRSHVKKKVTSYKEGMTVLYKYKLSLHQVMLTVIQ